MGVDRESSAFTSARCRARSLTPPSQQFIWYGLITIVAGFASFWIIQDFPVRPPPASVARSEPRADLDHRSSVDALSRAQDTAKFLTEPERAFVIRRLKNDSQASAGGESFSWSAIRAALTDWKVRAQCRLSAPDPCADESPFSPEQMWLSMLIYAGSDGQSRTPRAFSRRQS